MALFVKREVIFRTSGGKERWKAAKEALKAAAIPVMEASSYEGELPICSCGAKVDRRNYGEHGWIDRRVYYIAVRPQDTEKARALLLETVGGPLESDELVLPAKKIEAI